VAFNSAMLDDRKTQPSKFCRFTRKVTDYKFSGESTTTTTTTMLHQDIMGTMSNICGDA
jgi:hypothetical protein